MAMLRSTLPFVLVVLGAGASVQPFEAPFEGEMPFFDSVVAAADGHAQKSRPGGNVQSSIDHLKLFDCRLGYVDWNEGSWMKLWTPEWKQWCCEHESRGCPSTSTATATTVSETTLTKTSATKTTKTTTTTTRTSTDTTVTTTTTNVGCRTSCTLGSETATCEDRMRDAMLDPEVLDGANAFGNDDFRRHVCWGAGEMVMSQCDSCHVCAVDEWCEKGGYSTTTNLYCSNTCDFGGHSATCEDRMTWAMAHNSQVSFSDDPCMAAGELVMSQCPICHTCSVPWWCEHVGRKHEEKQTATIFMKKFENIDVAGFLARTGFSMFTSASLLMACFAAGAGFALVWRRTGTMRASVPVAAEDQAIEGYSDPLCPMSNEQDLSESA